MKANAYEKVTERIIALLEEGSCPWRKTWNAPGGSGPRSLSTGKLYRGGNYLWLSMIGGGDSWWGTYRQIASLGGQVRKGEKGTVAYFWNFVTEDKKTGKKLERAIPLVRTFTVFEVSQADWPEGLPAKVQKARDASSLPPLHERLEAAEALVEEYTGQLAGGLHHGGDGAFYRPSEDRVQMPHLDAFERAEEYYSTLYHELGHSTGHESRLKRLEPTSFGSHEYSFEELVAEMTATFLMVEAGIALPETEQNSAAYLRSWISKLEANPKWLIQAAGKAQKAADMILGRKPEQAEVEA